MKALGKIPGSADISKHPTLWNHPLPAWTDNGLKYIEGSHWTESTHTELIIWLGICLDSIQKWIYGPEAHRKYLTSHKRITIACAEAREKGAEGRDFAKIVDSILPTIKLTIPEEDQIEGAVIQADRARKYLWSLANATDPKTRPSTMNALAHWTTKHHPEILLRLSAKELVPRPPASILPASRPLRTTTRAAKLAAKPTSDPADESPY